MLAKILWGNLQVAALGKRFVTACDLECQTTLYSLNGAGVNATVLQNPTTFRCIVGPLPHLLVRY